MAKVQIEDDYVDIQLSLLEKLGRAEHSRRVPLLHIKGVDTYPPENPHLGWVDALRESQPTSSGSMFDGGLPSSFRARDSRESSRMLTIDLCDEDVQRVLVELDDESPEIVADRIRLAVAAAQASAIEQMRARSAGRELPPMPRSEPPPPPPFGDLMSDTGPHGIPYRITPLPPIYSEPAPPMRLDDDRSLTKLGAWLIGFGILGLVTGAIMLSAGALPGLLAIGAGTASACMGGVALAVVAQHQ
jgi:hypothetical protein